MSESVTRLQKEYKLPLLSTPHQRSNTKQHCREQDPKREKGRDRSKSGPNGMYCAVLGITFHKTLQQTGPKLEEQEKR